MNIFNVEQIFKNARERGSISSLETLVLLEKRQFDCDELVDIANELNEKVNGKIVTYVKGKKIYYTNICRAKCKFCSFYTVKNRKNAYTRTAEDIIKELKRSSWVQQLVLEGGLNPDLDVSYHVNLIREIKSRFPKLYIQGYTPTEIAFMARRARGSVKDIMNQLRDAGLNSMNGDSAEVLNDKLRKKIRQDKLKVSDWLEIIKYAHKINLPTPISLMAGHIETGIHLSEHLDIIKSVQKETGFFTNLIISPFVPQNTALARERKIPTEINFERLLYVTAITRLSLGEQIRNITIDWSKLKTEQTIRLIKAGANDLGIMEFDNTDVTPFKRTPQWKINTKKMESQLKREGKVLMQRNPYSLKKPKYVYLNDSYIVESGVEDNVKRSRK